MASIEMLTEHGEAILTDVFLSESSIFLVFAFCQSKARAKSHWMPQTPEVQHSYFQIQLDDAIIRV